jgi:protein involved in polysaccharide export with SLBB domain
MRKGRFNLPPNGDLRVSEAVMSASPTQFANLGRVRLERDGRTYRIDVNKVLNRGDLEADAVVQPGDKILVDERLFNF